MIARRGAGFRLKNKGWRLYKCPFARETKGHCHLNGYKSSSFRAALIYNANLIDKDNLIEGFAE